MPPINTRPVLTEFSMSSPCNNTFNNSSSNEINFVQNKEKLDENCVSSLDTLVGSNDF